MALGPAATRADGAGLAGRLTAFTQRVADDAAFRRALEARPGEALARAGLHIFAISDPLPVPAGREALDIDADLLYGPEPHRSGTLGELPLEARLVQYALRPMALVHCPAQTATQVRALAADCGLHAVLSPWGFRPAYNAKSNGYVNTVTDVHLGDASSRAWRGVLVSTDIRYVAVGWLGLYYGWDLLLGLALGYPACCVAAFPPRWQTAVAEFDGEVADVLVRSHSPEAPIVISHPGANVFARHFGYHVIEHFPCEFDCPETARLAARILSGLEFFEPQTARELARVLAAPVYRHRAGETFLFPDGRFDEHGTLTYTQVWATDPTSVISRGVVATTALAPSPEGWLLHSDTGR